ncbi:hypothetical protein ACIPL1_25745 [Pseudomonas sp. NPDC090202]|uniref:hypothetical protein n=1 Tax=unclassified Pseudomonas TaxID=196821 RepID=UPI00381C7B7C
MNRSVYLATPAVQHFVEWLSRHLDSAALQHRYTHRKTRQDWQFQGVSDAWRQYHWSHPAISRLNVEKGSTAASNAKALAALQTDLQAALQRMDDDAACQAAIEVMIWGGVQGRNVNWLQQNRKGLAATLVATRDAIDQGQLDVAILCNKALRFNAGMTKVYSLICRDFIIYDSRVAAALGWLVVRYCEEQGLSAVPKTLAFPWAAAKEDNTATPKNRNPGQGSLSFPRLRTGAFHAQWNMRASWLLHAVLASGAVTGEAFTGENALRNLEAALFMLGYDLGGHRNDNSSAA